MRDRTDHFCRIIAWLFAAMVLVVFPVQAHTLADRPGETIDHRVVNLFDAGCVFATNAKVDLDAADRAFAEARGDCSTTGKSFGGRYGWLAVDLTGLDLPEGALRYKGDIAPVAGITVATWNAVGERNVHSYSPEQLMEYWTIGTRFSLPLSDAGERPAKIMIGVDRPWSRLAMTSIEITGEEAAISDHYSRTVIFAILLGFATIPILYSASFFIVMRHPFMLRHAAMAVSILVYVLVSSNIAMHFFPGLDMKTRLSLSYASAAFAIAMAGLFSVSFLEPGSLSKWVRRYLVACSALLLVVGGLMMTVAYSFPLVGRTVYHLSYLPMLAAFFLVAVQAVKRGSKAVYFLLAGWSAVMIIGLDRLARGADIYVLPSVSDFYFHFALIVEAVVTAFGVAYRMMVIKRERDDALEREIELTELAENDTLTGLRNRHCFDRDHDAGETGMLAILDIDHFKAVNDQHGHIVGDRVLRVVGRVLHQAEGDSVLRASYRLGGEEFALAPTASNLHEAKLHMETLRRTISVEIARQVAELFQPVTVSIGLAGGRSNLYDAYKAADDALYRAKQQGRNRVVTEDGRHNRRQTDKPSEATNARAKRA